MPAGLKRAHDVFGVSNQVLPDSYVDRGHLDDEIQRLLQRPTHIALRGESKCGKSWLRQRNIPNALTVQCRLEKSVLDVYVDALSQLDIRLEIERTSGHSFKGKVEAKGSIGTQLLAAVGIGVSAEGKLERGRTQKSVGHDVEDLRFIADLIKASGRKLVIEDFHYLSVAERKRFAFDLKALWDYGLFVVIVGVWSQSNMLLFLNPDLTGRISEVSIYWSDEDLERIINKGGNALGLLFSVGFKKSAVSKCFGNAGILQTLILRSLDEKNISIEQHPTLTVDDVKAVDDAAMAYAEQLNPLYQQFATRVSSGMRHRQDSTGIYAHAMAAILDASDDELVKGLNLDKIYEVAHARESRIHKGNLRSVLEKFEELQVDSDGRGLVLSYNDATREISVVDRQLLLYRSYSTVKWPWEDLIAEAAAKTRDGG
jgi:hypothetical protein